MMEAKNLAAHLRQLFIIGPRLLQEDERAVDVGVNEVAGSVDGAIDVRLGCEI
jgi:hypothetical protein